MVLVDQWDDLGQPRPASAKIIPPGGMILVDRWDDFGPTIPIPPLFNNMVLLRLLRSHREVTRLLGGPWAVIMGSLVRMHGSLRMTR